MYPDIKICGSDGDPADKFRPVVCQVIAFGGVDTTMQSALVILKINHPSSHQHTNGRSRISVQGADSGSIVVVSDVKKPGLGSSCEDIYGVMQN